MNGSALGKLLFRKTRLNDALLLSTLLSTSLTNLKRKGYPVDRILRITAAKLKEATPSKEYLEEQKMEAARREDLKLKQSKSIDNINSLSKSGSNQNMTDTAILQGYVEQLQSLFPDADPEYLKRLVEAEGSDHVTNASNKVLDDPNYPRFTSSNVPNPPSSDLIRSQSNSSMNSFPGSNFFKSLGINRVANTIKNWTGIDAIQSHTPSSSNESSITPLPGAFPNKNQQEEETSRRQIERPIGDHTAEFKERLKNDLHRSISSCHSNTSSNLSTNFPTDPVVPEEYHAQCRAPSNNHLSLAGTLNGIDIYMDLRVKDMEILAQYREGFSKFARLLKLLAGVYSLPVSSLHIFFDDDGNVVAFNSNRTLFFNARYYLGLKTPAHELDSLDSYLSWFMTIAHELAHNYVSAHNSEHEFYLSSFAETFMPALWKMCRDEKVLI